MSDKKKRQLTDVMHARKPMELPDEREARKRAEFEEEGAIYHRHKAKPEESAIAKLARMVQEATGNASKPWARFIDDEDDK